MLLHRPVSFFLPIQVPVTMIVLGGEKSKEAKLGASFHAGSKRGKAEAAEVEHTHAEAALATAGAILISQRTDDFIIDIRHGERRGEGGSWWHGHQHRPHHLAIRYGMILEQS
jgi:hypothetical protein